jgi:hypothetical protein
MGHEIEPAPPFEDLCRVALRHEGTNSLHKRKRHELISRRKHRKWETNAPKRTLVDQRGARLLPSEKEKKKKKKKKRQQPRVDKSISE